ncbi:hypothetical protein NDU88_005903 [Pleurodeles waltl]|uniref:Uncharacterized protein n=1 Tax=Pleurodeles waltl TaxID=8319 RepID=A0AAV7NP58_PLEWA|nr:hypothetical protein NDU88_005903 [Pleurodeles waltl]
MGVVIPHPSPRTAGSREETKARSGGHAAVAKASGRAQMSQGTESAQTGAAGDQGGAGEMQRGDQGPRRTKSGVAAVGSPECCRGIINCRTQTQLQQALEGGQQPCLTGE